MGVIRILLIADTHLGPVFYPGSIERTSFAEKNEQNLINSALHPSNTWYL